MFAETDPSSLLDLAIAHHRAGRLAEAEAAYAALLRHDPNHADAMHLLGVMACKSGRHGEATERIRKAIDLDPMAPEYYNSLGAVQQALGRQDEAIGLYLQAIALKADYLDPYNNILRLRPQLVDVRFNLGCVLQGQGRTSEAIEQYEKILAIQSDHSGVLNNLGCAFRDLGRLDEAISTLRQATTVQPDYAEAHHNLGFVLQEKGAIDEAIAEYHITLSLKPDFADAHMDFGRALQLSGEIDKAILQYQKTIELVPNHVKAHYNWASALHELGRDEEAIAKYGEAIRCDPGSIESHVNRALVLLVNGRYQEGWPEYEWRLQRPDWRAANSYYPELPRWQGEVAADKRILVQAEQGFGDTIQFARYLPQVKERCGRLIVEAQPELHPLLATIPAIDELITRQPENAQKADAAVHIMSLPGIFGTTVDTVPAACPYFSVPLINMERWRDKISGAGFKIGVAWSGNPAYPGNKDRSFGVDHFAGLAALPSVRLFSLQKGVAAEQLQKLPSGMEIIDLGPDLHDFADTAAAIMHLDLIVSVDTALVHLAGALGRPIWTLRYFCPYWVWGLTGPSTPWYPSMRVFRQQRPGGWDMVFREVCVELEKILPGKEKRQR
ncbi:MAG: tetratricopeptide repeat-containing glycosyltransferase family protein [Pseudomonadota bacterium]